MYIDPSRKQSALIESSNSGQQRDVMRSKAPGIRNALRVGSCQYAGLDAVDSSLKNVTAAHTGKVPFSVGLFSVGARINMHVRVCIFTRIFEVNSIRNN